MSRSILGQILKRTILGGGRRQPQQQPQRRTGGGGLGGGGFKIRLLIAVGIIAFAFISYNAKKDVNEVTGEAQRVSMNEEEEIQLGLQAAPEMVNKHGGLLQSFKDQQRVDQIGEHLLLALRGELMKQKRKNPYPFEFYLLDDSKTVNAFALPGGQVFITSALYTQLETEGQLAGVIGHEIGHVLARHGAQRIAKQQFTQKLIGAAGVLGGDANSARMAAAVGQLINMKYGQGDELESDGWGVRLMVWSGYDPNSMLGVMDILERASGGGGPGFLSTHPKPANRKEYILKVIKDEFPGGLPSGLQP